MKKTIIVVGILALVIFGGELLINKMEKVETKTEPEQVEVKSKITDELQRIIDEENFKKETLLRARLVANDRKKAEEIARNKKAMEVIEAEYETIRQAELELVGGSNTSSLK